MAYFFKEYKIQYPIKAYLFLMKELGFSMAEAQKYINKGKVQYNGQILSNNEKNKMIEKSVNVLTFKSESKGLKPLFANEYFAIFNKPAKMLIHPKGRFSHHSLLDEIYANYSKNATLIHRIDKETSGLVLVGQNKKIATTLGNLFLQNKIKKEYLALIKGKMQKDCCCILPLATQEKGGDLCVRSLAYSKNLAQKYQFKEAKTEFEILGFLGDFTLLKARLFTGRTHQIRAHLSSLGHSILGDPLYGCLDSYSREYLDGEFIENEKCAPLSDEKRIEYFGAKRLMLHSYQLEFNFNGKEYRFCSPFCIKSSKLKL